MNIHPSTIFSLLCAALFFLVFLFLARKRSIHPFYTTTWFFVSISGVGAAIFYSALNDVALFFGLTSATELIMSGLFFFCLMTLLQLSVRASVAGDRIQELISYTAILEHRIRHLEQELKD